jgi:tRNA 2-thiouridine synthesizing protein E
MFTDVTMDEMFPRAEPVVKPPLPVLKTEQMYASIEQKAGEIGLNLNEKQWEVIDFVMDFYEICDDCKNARTLADILQEEYAEQGGRRYLYQLFPKGPLTTIHDLVELPNLGHESDKSFGTSW